MRIGGMRLRMLLGGIGAVGVVAAHVVAYLIAFPDAHHRAEALAATGHHHWGLTVAIALGLLLACVVGFVMSGVRFVGDGSRLHPAFGSVVPRLVIVQLLGFAVLEALERSLSADPLSHLFSEPAVLIGLVLQALLAVAGSLLVVLLSKVVERIASRRSLPSPSRPVSTWPRQRRYTLPRFEVAVGAGTLRGPPVVS